MRPAKVSDEEMYRELAEVFRRKGYDGASYSDLREATGLVKASLYHRFPGGKEDMVDAILSKVDREFAERVLKPAWEAGPPAERARQIARRMREFYEDGKKGCLLDTLTLADSPAVMRHAQRSMDYWAESFARLAREAGLPPSVARCRAEEAIAAIEGGLIVARVSRNRRAFLSTLANLPKHLTAPRLP